MTLARRGDILWMIEHHPDAPVLGEPCATIYPSGHILSDPEGFAQARELWLKTTASSVSIQVTTNAAIFFLTTDPPCARELMASIWLRRRESPKAVAQVYALAITGRTALTSRGQPDAVIDWSLGRDCTLQLLNARDAAVVDEAAAALLNPTLPATDTFMPSSDVLRIKERLLFRVRELTPFAGDVANQLAQVYRLQASFAQVSAASREKEFALLAAARSLGGNRRRSDYGYRYMNAAVETGRLDIAAAGARLCLDRVARQEPDVLPDDVHDCNLVLGRVALRRGKIRTAGKYLIAAGRTSGSPALGSFGPGMMLAQELLQVGRRKPVLEYLRLCSRFWKLNSRTDEWAVAIRTGKFPDFGANLLY